MQSKDYESSFYGEVIKDEFIGVVFNTAPSEISSLQLIINPALDKDFMPISEEIKIDVNF